MHVRTFGLTAILAILAPLVFAQIPAVHQEYYSKLDSIVIKTDRLIILDSPGQFLEVQFVGRCPKQPTGGTPKITIEVFARSLAPVYQKDNDHRITIIADDKITDLGLMSYESLEEIPDQVRDIYPLPGTRNLVKRIPTPASAQIKVSNPGKFLVAETMSTGVLRLDLIDSITQAKTLRFKLGPTTIDFKPNQMAVLLGFARSVSLPDPNAPLADGLPPEEKSVDLPPLDLNNASLETTMDWLRKQLAVNGRVTGVKFEMVENSGCMFTIRLDADRTDPPANEITSYSPTLDFTANLAYLNPELIRIDDSRINSRVWVATTNQSHKIETYSRLGGTGKHFDERMSSVAAFDLRKNGSASLVRDAILHAIKLCQGSPDAK
ncbi:MAG TPA: hypothetical protein VII34_10015 [Pyrinomonadaceae bacterium]